MSNEFYSVGLDLVKYAQSVSPADRVGPITRLFPFIYEASQSMGVREISRWLSEERKISISPSTISRALRFQDPHWEGFSSIVQPHLRTIEEYISADFKSVLFEEDDEQMYREFASAKADVAGHGPSKASLECLSSLSFLEVAWFTLDFRTRMKCFDYLAGDAWINSDVDQ
jgi:hypothetical protein